VKLPTNTRGTRVLDELGTRYEVVEYLYTRKGAGRAADAVGWDESQVVKTLVVETGARSFHFVLVPADRDLSTRKLGRLLEVTSAALASVRDAERLTGYVEGGISPFGSYTRLPVIMEERLLECDRVLVNAGHRGVLVALDPWDLQQALDAGVEDVVS
jgi:Cys-tRNA(Pro)/Cys-tRNA(Cys) deacylase